MSLRAKIEAVIYAAEEPVTLAQLAAIFAAELPPVEAVAPQQQPTTESLLDAGFLEASATLGPENDIAKVALLTGLEERENSETHAGDAESKRAARQRERDVREQLRTVLDDLVADYADHDRGMEIREVAGGYRIATKPEYHDAVRAFVKSLKPPMKLSLQALETLAVIAYKQPVTAPEVSEIRGVDSAGVLGSLVGRKLITTAGRKQVIGRPILYKTTREFLLRFGLKDIQELPSLEEFEKLAGEMGDDETLPDSPQPAGNSLLFPAEDAGASNRDALAAVDANAGEAGISVEPADPELAPAPVIALDSEAPEEITTENIEVIAPTHPTPPSEELEAGELQERKASDGPE